MDDLIAGGAAGIMVSAVDPKTESDYLNKVGGRSCCSTTDSDAPKTQPCRLHRLFERALPASKPVTSRSRPCGRRQVHGLCRPCSAPTNAKERIQGVKDKIKGSKIELVDVRGDDGDQTPAPSAMSRTR